MSVKTMENLYLETLRDLYSAETQLIEALPKVAEAATDPQLRQTVLEHLEATKTHAYRLKSIFEGMHENPKGHECPAMRGLIREADDFIKEIRDDQIRDAALIAAAQKVEHYEISGYGTARTFARILGHEEHADTLQMTLDEEQAADTRLNELGVGRINRQAAMAQPGVH